MHCRLCRNGCGGNKCPLGSFRYDEHLTWTELIQKYLPVKLEQSELQATTICEICCRYVKDFHVFYLQVEICQLIFDKGKEADEAVENETENEETGKDIENFVILNEAKKETFNDCGKKGTHIHDQDVVKMEAIESEDNETAENSEIGEGSGNHITPSEAKNETSNEVDTLVHYPNAYEMETNEDKVTETEETIKREAEDGETGQNVGSYVILNEAKTETCNDVFGQGNVEHDIKMETNRDEAIAEVRGDIENYVIPNEAKNEMSAPVEEQENLDCAQNDIKMETVKDKNTETAETLRTETKYMDILDDGNSTLSVSDSDSSAIEVIFDDLEYNPNDGKNIPAAEDVIENEAPVIEILDDVDESYRVLNEAYTESSDVEIVDATDEAPVCDQSDIKTETIEDEIVTETKVQDSCTEKSKPENNNNDCSSDDSIKIRTFDSSDEDEHKCKICAKVFESFNGLLNHMPKAHKHLKPFVCKICGLSMRFKFELQRHMIVAHKLQKLHNPKEADRTCAICNARLKSKRSLSRHMQTQHKGSKPFNCPRCGRKFTTKATYDLHSLSPECPKPKASDFDGIEYRTCGVCGKIFSSVNSLKGHVYKYHNGIKPFECLKCKAKFDLKQTLERHKLKNCKETPSESILVKKNTIEEERNTCNICFKKFDQFSSFYQHMSANHKGLKPFKCEICGKAYKIDGSLRKHLKTVHRKS